MANMIILIVICSSLLMTTECKKEEQRSCLTGHMTDVQSWVDEMGVLIAGDDNKIAIDVSANPRPLTALRQQMAFLVRGRNVSVKFLSMARCRLRQVPTVFFIADSMGSILARTVEYATFYGNDFADVSTPGELYDVTINATHIREWSITTPFLRQSHTTWSASFAETKLPKLKELDLRACSIQTITDYTFKGMPNLKALYIGENEIFHIEAYAFVGLDNLIHLDFSYNADHNTNRNKQTLEIESLLVLGTLKNLTSLDMSFTRLTQRHISLLRNIGPKLTRLSLCETGLMNLPNGIFSEANLRILDLSGNNGIFGGTKTLSGLEGSLQVLYAKNTRLRSMDVFEGFELLEVLDVSFNEINVVSASVTATLKMLQILDLDMNRVTSWFGPTFSLMPKLKLLSLRENNINLISKELTDDIANVNYVSMSGNFIVCNCLTKNFIETALHNERTLHYSTLEGKSDYIKGDPNAPIPKYHRGFIDYNKKILKRQNVTIDCNEDECFDKNEELIGKFLLLDYHSGSYKCLGMAESEPIDFFKVDGCNEVAKDIDYETVVEKTWNKLYIFFALPCILAVMCAIYVFRRNFKYCLITLRNSAMISLINRNEFIDDGTIFHYDVFVSYCNEDRNWVLDHLLPHLETECSVSACLHERDFQVGYSILENIVSCMDRSRSIMLIISQRFLLSQWCQFEMHLAQHRLLETRREDLTLVLLEDIPRRLRPNTLHYLMLTKTYIVWPNEETERALFWKRIKKTLVNMKLKYSSVEGVSLA